MNVNDALKSAALNTEQTQTQTRNTTAANPAGTAPPATKADSYSVRLSCTYQALETMYTKNGGFNAEKVEKLKAAIANGTFQIDADKIADGVIDTVKNLISARPA